MMRQFTTIAYPRPDGRAAGLRYERAVEAARVVAAHKGTGTAPAPGTFVARGVFPGPLCAHMPRCRDARVDAFFGRIDVYAGDAVYVIGLMSALGALRVAARRQALLMRLAAQSRPIAYEGMA